MISRTFERMHFAFPTPFQTGDVLLDIASPDPEHELMIFDKTEVSSNGKQYAAGYVLDRGLIIRDGVDPLNLVYYSGKRLPGGHRALEPMRKYLTGQLSITKLMNKYHLALCHATAGKVSTLMLRAAAMH